MTTRVVTDVANTTHRGSQALTSYSPIDTHYTFGLGPNAAWPEGTNSTHAIWRFKRKLQVEALTRAALEIAGRHAILRCALQYQDGGWRFFAEQAGKLHVAALAVGSLVMDREARARELMRAAIWQPFRLDEEAPFRVISVEIAAEDYLIGFVIHKAFAEGESVRIFSTELATLYDVFAHDECSPLKQLRLQYVDYMTAMQKWIDGPLGQASLSYWSAYLEGSRGLQHSRGLHREARFTLTRKLSDELRELSEVEGIRCPVIWEALHHIALAGIVEHADVTTLNVVRGRKGQELNDLIGSFVNLLPSRSRILPNLTFRQLLRRLLDTRIEALSHSAMPCNVLAERCSLTLTDFPHFNFLSEAVSPTKWFGEQLEARDGDRMITSIQTRTSLKPPAPPPVPSLERTSNPYLTTPYVLVVMDTPEFDVICVGAISSPFTPAGLARNLESVAQRIAADPDCQLNALAATK